MPVYDFTLSIHRFADVFLQILPHLSLYCIGLTISIDGLVRDLDSAAVRLAGCEHKKKAAIAALIII